jgi:hypothetical protein
MSGPITAGMLYNLVQCPHPVTVDLFADPVPENKITRAGTILREVS